MCGRKVPRITFFTLNSEKSREMLLHDIYFPSCIHDGVIFPSNSTVDPGNTFGSGESREGGFESGPQWDGTLGRS